MRNYLHAGLIVLVALAIMLWNKLVGGLTSFLRRVGLGDEEDYW